MQNYEVQRMNNHIGSDFDDFLSEQGLAEEVSAAALKRVIAWQIAQAMKEQHVSKKTLADRMHTSRTAVDRALDQNDTGHTGQRCTGIRTACRSPPGARAQSGTGVIPYAPSNLKAAVALKRLETSPE